MKGFQRKKDTLSTLNEQARVIWQEQRTLTHRKRISLLMTLRHSLETCLLLLASSSNIFETCRLGPCERSPIKTLSEDRIHVSRRLGPLRSDDDDEDDNAFNLQLQQVLSSKAAGKRIAKQPKERKKRAGRSPVQGIAPKRRRTTKAHPSPRRKLMMDAIMTGGRGQ